MKPVSRSSGTWLSHFTGTPNTSNYVGLQQHVYAILPMYSTGTTGIIVTRLTGSEQRGSTGRQPVNDDTAAIRGGHLCNEAESGKDDAPCFAKGARGWVSRQRTSHAARSVRRPPVPVASESSRYEPHKYLSSSAATYPAAERTTVSVRRAPATPGLAMSRPEPGSAGIH